ncbi:TPA: hypothetical protein RQO74_000282 [Klebsiella michiganensis]|nr:hypothetical protein [Klebsiella michiganensis]
MSNTDTANAKLYANQAQVAAAQAKIYAQAGTDASQAAAEAQNYANQAENSSSTAELYSNISATQAQSSSLSAEAAALSAEEALSAVVDTVKQQITFTTGGTLNSALDRISDGTYLYYWTGTFPKVIPPLSTVDSSGGIGVAAWACDTDLPFRTSILSTDGAGDVGVRQGRFVQDSLFYLCPGNKSVDPYNNFGTAMNLAISSALAQGSGMIFIPGGRYTLDTTITATLTRSLTIIFSADAYIQVNTPMDAFSFNINGCHLNILANGARIMSNWGSADGSAVAALRMIDATLDKSCSVTDLKVGMSDATSRFGYAIYGSALNLPTFHRCLLQGNVGIYLESALLNGASAHAMGAQIMFCEIYTTTFCVSIANQGALGCEGLIIAGGEFISSGTAIKINNVGLTSSSYLPPLVRVNMLHINAYQGLYVKDVQDLYVMGVEFQSKHNPTTVVNGILELGGVQKLHHHDNTYTSVAYSGGTDANKASPIYQFASTLTNAYFKSSGNIYQLDGMTNPAFAFQSTSNIATVTVSDDTLQSLASWTTSTYKNYVRLPSHAIIGDLGASSGLDYSSTATFSSNVLALGTRPPQGFTYNIGTSIVPSISTINQITFPPEMIGKEVNILLSAAEVTLTHGTNLVCPDQKTIVMTLPNVIKVFAINSTQCRVINVGGITSRHTDITTAPTSQASSGYYGAEFFDTSTGKYYKYFSGYGWRYMNTVAVGS